MVLVTDTLTRTYGKEIDMQEPTREQFENWYREAWLNDIRKEKAKKQLAVVEEPPKKLKAVKPKAVERIKLSEKARVVNRMVIRGFNSYEISDMLGVSRQSVDQIRNRYALPRQDEE